MTRKKTTPTRTEPSYDAVLADVVGLVEAARHASARAVIALLTATYWSIGRRIVEQEQHGVTRAGYGEELIVKLSGDLQARFGRGFGRANLFQMRAFYISYREVLQIASGELALPPAPGKVQTASGQFVADGMAVVASRFPLPWSHYVRLLAVRNPEARRFYETEALRGGWTIRQLDRQIGTQFYERTALSRNKAAMLRRGEARKQGDAVTPEEEIKDPYVLEFLGLEDEFSESDLEAALIAKIESFLLELGGVDKFTHADAGQMHLYLNYAREHWTLDGENPPVGLVLCAEKDSAVARYALEGLPNKVLASEYRTALPKERTLVAEIERTIQQFEARRPIPRPRSRRPKK